MNDLSAISHPWFDLFLLGFTAACSMVAALFFLRFWSRTRDLLFLSFAAFFLVEGATRATVLLSARPNEADLWIYAVRLLSVLLVLAAIYRKNFGRG